MEANNEINFIVQEKGRYNIQAVSLFELLNQEGGDQKRIPAYQRPYSWDKGNVTDLLSDLLKSFERNGNSSKWFLGMIFTCQEDSRDRTVDLLDGQQRVTTLMLLFRALYLFPYWYGEQNYENFKVRLNRADQSKLSDEEQILAGQKEFEKAQKKLRKCMQTEVKEGYDLVDKARFVTGGPLEALFNEFILNTFKINYDNFQKLDGIRVTGSEPLGPTLSRLNENYSVIKDEIKRWVEEPKGGSKKISSLKDLSGFVDHVLFDVVLINVPLYQKNSVLEIFESLNNRGKSLNLVDIIRFKCLKAYSDDAQKLSKMEEDWGTIYEVADRISLNGSGGYKKPLFPSTKVFLERFINSISDKDGGYTDNKSRIEAFENKYGERLDTGTQEIKSVLERAEYILFLDAGNCLFKNAPLNIKSKVRAVIQTLNLALRVSETAQVAFFSYLNNRYRTLTNSDPGIGHFKDVCNDLLEIIKSVFYINIATATRSNVSRNIYVFMARSFFKLPGGDKENTPFTYKYFGHKKYQDEDLYGGKSLPQGRLKRTPETIKNVVFSTDNEESKFVLSVYQCIVAMGNMPSRGDFKEEELEHIVPEKWMNNLGWKSNLRPDDFLKIVTESDVQEDLASVFKTLCDSEEFLSKRAYSKTFVQLIGNKCVVYKGPNINLSNKYWEDHEGNGRIKDGKRTILLKKQGTIDYMIMPSIPNLIDFESFHLKEVVGRCSTIIDEIFDGFHDLEFKP